MFFKGQVGGGKNQPACPTWCNLVAWTSAPPIPGNAEAVWGHSRAACHARTCALVPQQRTDEPFTVPRPAHIISWSDRTTIPFHIAVDSWGLEQNKEQAMHSHPQRTQPTLRMGEGRGGASLFSPFVKEEEEDQGKTAKAARKRSLCGCHAASSCCVWYDFFFVPVIWQPCCYVPELYGVCLS